MELVHAICSVTMFSLYALAGAVGVVALSSPKLFAVAAEKGGLWLAPPKTATVYQKPIDIDQFVVRHSRKFGALVVTVVAFLSLLFLGQIDSSWMPTFLLLISGMSVIFVFSGLVELGGEVSKIERQLADARVDPLTGLANRRAFDEEMQRRLSDEHEDEQPFCVALVDVDNFKEINDTHGHLTGDKVLKNKIADALRESMRTTNLAARYGGDEFALILPATRLADAVDEAEQIRAAIVSEPLPVDNSTLAVTVTIGVAAVAANDSVDAVIKRADDALYAAKVAGRNQVGHHDGQQISVASEPLVPA